MKPKRILFLHQFFRHPGEPGGTRAYWVSKELIKNGFEVTIITQRNSYYKEYKDVSNVERVDIDGIDVVYLKNGYSNEMSFPRRIVSFLIFMLKSTWYGLKEKDISLVIASSTPISIGFPALVLKKLKRIPLLFEVRDLWPDIPVEMGIIKNRFLISIFKWFEKTIYRNSVHVVALSPGMAAGVARYIDQSKVTMIPNVAKIDKFWPREKNLKQLGELGLSGDSFKIIHFGAMGLVNGLDYFVDAAVLAGERKLNNIEFILVGPGSQKNRYKKIKSEKGLSNLHILDRLPMDQISELVNSCDVSYMGVSHLYPILKHNSANKFFDSLSAGKPILLNFGGWLEVIVNENECGFYTDPMNPEDLLNKILELQGNPALCESMGRNARRIAEQKYDKSILCPEYAVLVRQLTSGKE